MLGMIPSAIVVTRGPNPEDNSRKANDQTASSQGLAAESLGSRPFGPNPETQGLSR